MVIQTSFSFTNKMTPWNFKHPYKSQHLFINKEGRMTGRDLSCFTQWESPLNISIIHLTEWKKRRSRKKRSEYTWGLIHSSGLQSNDNTSLNQNFPPFLYEFLYFSPFLYEFLYFRGKISLQMSIFPGNQVPEFPIFSRHAHLETLPSFNNRFLTVLFGLTNCLASESFVVSFS